MAEKQNPLSWQIHDWILAGADRERVRNLYSLSDGELEHHLEQLISRGILSRKEVDVWKAGSASAAKGLESHVDEDMWRRLRDQERARKKRASQVLGLVLLGILFGVAYMIVNQPLLRDAQRLPHPVLGVLVLLGLGLFGRDWVSWRKREHWFPSTGVWGVVLVMGALAGHFWVTLAGASSCERAARADISKLGQCLERFANDREDLNCRDFRLPPDVLQVLVGPYYGWGGTNRKCDVRVWIQGDEVRGCALKGAFPEGPRSRYIYRTRLATGSDLPVRVGSPSPNGEAYGGRGRPCYTESMIDSGCGFRRPNGILCENVG
ncbi:MAG: hypothetical protein AB1646_26800 [Thermodesulfobacteriota bacterium]